MAEAAPRNLQGTERGGAGPPPEHGSGDSWKPTLDLH